MAVQRMSAGRSVLPLNFFAIQTLPTRRAVTRAKSISEVGTYGELETWTQTFRPPLP